MQTILNKLVLYPTLLYGRTMEYLGFRHWYTRIDDHCILGALPMTHNFERMVKEERINAVLTMNEDHELEYSVPLNEWKRLNVEHKQVAIVDYTGVASLEQINESVDYICKHRQLNQTVYVHCKAGRYRSALIVACYVMNTRKMRPEEAVDFVEKKRSHVILRKPRQLNALHNYYDHLKKNNNISPKI